MRLRKNLDNAEVLARFRKYSSEKLVGQSYADPSDPLHICSFDEAVSVVRLMSDDIGVPLAELKISQIKEFIRNLRKGGRADPWSSELVKVQRTLTVQRVRLAIEFFLDFRREGLK